MGSPRILVFDSGVGSLSIGGEIAGRLPGAELHFAMDNAGFPYGEWSESALQPHICSLILKLLPSVRPDLIVVACNSASTAVLPSLRSQVTIPVVGVVPAIKPAAALTENGHIVILATPGTAARDYTRQLVSDFAAHCTVSVIGNAELAEAAEALYHRDQDPTEVCQRAVKSILSHQQPPDTVVLACTHFPLLLPYLRATAPSIKHWVDSGQAIARRVQSLLDLPESSGGTNGHHVWFSALPDADSYLPAKLEQAGIRHIHLMP